MVKKGEEMCIDIGSIISSVISSIPVVCNLYSEKKRRRVKRKILEKDFLKEVSVLKEIEETLAETLSVKEMSKRSSINFNIKALNDYLNFPPDKEEEINILIDIKQNLKNIEEMYNGMLRNTLKINQEIWGKAKRPEEIQELLVESLDVVEQEEKLKDSIKETLILIE